MNSARGFLLAIVAAALSFPTAANAADAVLSGTSTRRRAKARRHHRIGETRGRNDYDDCLTDESGRYYFPPLAAGQISRLGAGGERLRPARAKSNCRAAHRQDFIARAQRGLLPQLPGNVMLAALPEETSTTSA